MSEIKKVAVKLKARGYVDGVIKEAGDIVLIDEKTPTGEPFAREFGEVLRGKDATDAIIEKVEE